MPPAHKPPVMIVDYDPRWPLLYEQEKALILRAIGARLVRLEHVGSTSVPGLAAKPIIDILAGLSSLADASACLAPLQAIGYQYVPEYEAEMPERRYFRKGNLGNSEWHVTHHLHMVEVAGEFWQNHVLFRDTLRAQPEIARRYARLKRELAARYGSNREGYTDAKTDFIQSVVAHAREASSPLP